MFVGFGKTFVAVALAVTLGAHWVLLQSVAWMGMVVAYSEHATIKEAIVQTFDGKHPCGLCKAIAVAKKSEKKTEFTLQIQKLEFPLPRERFVFTPPSQFWLVPAIDCFADFLSQKPPTPPPRGRLA
jgi:hypothetical protein